MFKHLMRMSKIDRAKLLQSTEQALVVGVLKAPTQTSAVRRLCCRRSYVLGARPPFSADNEPCVWIQDALMRSFILLSQRCIVTNWRRWSGQRYYLQVRILNRFGAQSVRALPLTDTPYQHIPKELEENIPTVWASFEFSGTVCQSRHFYSPTQLDVLRKRPDG